MHQDRLLLNDFLDKPYQPNGTGSPGYDCYTLAEAVLHKFVGFTPVSGTEEIRKLYWKLMRKEILLKGLDMNLSLVWYGSFSNFNAGLLQPFDVILYRIFSNNLHIGTYIGQNQVLTTKVNSTSGLIQLDDVFFGRLICGIYRK